MTGFGASGRQAIPSKSAVAWCLSGPRVHSAVSMPRREPPPRRRSNRLWSHLGLALGIGLAGGLPALGAAPPSPPITVSTPWGIPAVVVPAEHSPWTLVQLQIFWGDAVPPDQRWLLPALAARVAEGRRDNARASAWERIDALGGETQVAYSDAVLSLSVGVPRAALEAALASVAERLAGLPALLPPATARAAAPMPGCTTRTDAGAPPTASEWRALQQKVLRPEQAVMVVVGAVTPAALRRALQRLPRRRLGFDGPRPRETGGSESPLAAAGRLLLSPAPPGEPGAHLRHLAALQVAARLGGRPVVDCGDFWEAPAAPLRAGTTAVTPVGQAPTVDLEPTHLEPTHLEPANLEPTTAQPAAIEQAAAAERGARLFAWRDPGVLAWHIGLLFRITGAFHGPDDLLAVYPSLTPAEVRAAQDRLQAAARSSIAATEFTP